MAGESPDKSEQQKSSGTARSESDPRLAVFREPSAEAGSGTDTATAVFRTGPGQGLPGKDSESGNGAGSDPVDTATAVFRTRPSAQGEGEDAGSDRDTEQPDAEDAEDVEDAEGAQEPAEGVKGASGASDEPSEAAEPSESVEDAESEDAAGPAQEADRTEPAESAEGDEPTEPAEGDARLRAVVAAWVATDDVENDGAAKDAVAEDEAADDADADAGPDSADDDTASDDTADDDTAADDTAAKDDAPEPVTPGAGATDEVTTSNDAGADASDEPSADADASEEPSADADAGVDASDEPSGDAGADASGDVEDAEDAEDTEAPEADVEGVDGRAGKPDAEKPDSADEPGADSKSEADKSEADKPDPTGGRRGGDQPTAVFRAPAAAVVDHPTTALKITRPTPKPDAETKPEPAAERTSTFVPLRGEDARPAPASGGSGVPGSSAKSGTTGAPASAPALARAERTTQQPLPPKPPLDLLAELTNTPPPPQTPVRTLVRRIKIWTPLVLLLLIVFVIVQMVRPLPEPELGLSVDPAYTFKGEGLNLSWPSQGQSAVSVDGVGSMGSAGAQKPAPIASVAKVMTAYVVLKGHPLTGKEEGEKITVDQQAEDESKREDESTAPITKGQQFTQKQLLQLLMIPSGNNAARLFARWDSPSEKEFVVKMNAAAEELGMTNTTYTDPSGLEKTTVSTAEDQLKLAKAVMQNEVFREIVDTPQIDIPGIDQTIYNNNTILLEPGVSGVKTGSSTPAGGNLLWSANTVVDGKKLWIYGAVMGQQAGTGQPYDSLKMSLDNSLKLIKGVQKAVTSAAVVKKGDVVGYVDDGLGGRTPVVATRDLKAKGWPGLEVELSVSDNGKEIPHDASAGTEVGVVTVGTGPGRVSAPVALQQDLKAPGFGQKIARIM